MNIGVVQQPDFGQRLKQLRQERSLSQRDVAGDVVNPSYISLLESGARVPTLEVVVQLADALGVSTDTLLGANPLTDGHRGHRSPDAAKRLVSDLITRSSIDYGDLVNAQTSYEQAFADAISSGAILTALEYGIELQEILNLRGHRAERHRLLTELSDLAEDAEVPELSVKIDTERASAARDNRQPKEALELAERAGARIESTAFAYTPEHIRTLGVLISVLCEYGDGAEVPALIKQILGVAEHIGGGGAHGRAHWVAAVAYVRLGRPELATEHVHQAKRMLAMPATSLQEWARFSRAAASTLLDAGADIAEIEQYLKVARFALEMVDLPGERATITVLEARFALASGDPRRALELAVGASRDLPDIELVRLQIALGSAHGELGETEQAIEDLRAAASLAEQNAQYRLATKVWRQIDALRSA